MCMCMKFRYTMQHVEPKTIKNPTPAIAVDVGDN